MLNASNEECSVGGGGPGTGGSSESGVAGQEETGGVQASGQTPPPSYITVTAEEQEAINRVSLNSQVSTSILHLHTEIYQGW